MAVLAIFTSPANADIWSKIRDNTVGKHGLGAVIEKTDKEISRTTKRVIKEGGRIESQARSTLRGFDKNVLQPAKDEIVRVFDEIHRFDCMLDNGRMHDTSKDKDGDGVNDEWKMCFDNESTIIGVGFSGDGTLTNVSISGATTNGQTINIDVPPSEKKLAQEKAVHEQIRQGLLFAEALKNSFEPDERVLASLSPKETKAFLDPKTYSNYPYVNDKINVDSDENIKKGLSRSQEISLLKEEIAFNKEILEVAERIQKSSELYSPAVLVLAMADVPAATLRDSLGWSTGKAIGNGLNRLGTIRKVADATLDVASSETNDELTLRVLSRMAKIPFPVPDTYASTVVLFEYSSSSSETIKEGKSSIVLLKTRNDQLNQRLDALREQDMMDYINNVLEMREKAKKDGSGSLLNKPIPVPPKN